MKLKCSRQIFEKYSDIKFHENSSSGSGVIPTRTEGQSDITKLILGFCVFRQRAKKLVDRVLNITDRSLSHS